jgi:hypothetical protein
LTALQFAAICSTTSFTLAARAGSTRVFAAVAGVDHHNDVALAGRRRRQLDRRFRGVTGTAGTVAADGVGAGGGAASDGLSNRSTTRRLPYCAFGARVKLFG